MGKRLRPKNKIPLLNLTPPMIKVGNPTMDPVGTLPFHNLKIQLDKKDEKTPEVSTTPIPLLEGAVGTAPKNSISNLDTVTEEHDEIVACKLRM